MSKPAPNVLLLMATGCAHCPAVLKSLQELEAVGEIGKLEAINITDNPEAAAEYGVRSVPFVKIGTIELTGSQTKAELLRAIEQSQSVAGLSEYYDNLLNNGQLNEALENIRKNPEQIAALFRLLKQSDIKISVQIGIGAIMEELAGSEILIHQIPALTKLCDHPMARVRNDACFYLSLTRQAIVKHTIEKLLNDPDSDVRETAQDCLDELAETPMKH